MDSLMSQPVRFHYSGYAVKGDDGAYVLDNSDKKRANYLEQKFSHSDKKSCLVDKSDKENTFVALPSSKEKLKLFIVFDGMGTVPMAQGEKGLLFLTAEVKKGRNNNDWQVCDKSVMQVTKATGGHRAGRASVAQINGDKSLYKHYREVPGESLTQKLSRGYITDTQKFELAQRCLQAYEAVNKAGRDIKTVIRPEAIMCSDDGQEVAFLNDDYSEQAPAGARAKGTCGKEAYCFPEAHGHHASQEQKDALSFAIVLMNMFSDEGGGCSAARVRVEGGRAKVYLKERLIMKEVGKNAPEVRLACLQLFRDMSSGLPEARPALRQCLDTLTEQAHLYSAILQSVESKEANAMRCRKEVHSLQQQITKVTNSKVLQSVEREKQLSCLKKQLSDTEKKLEECEKNIRSIIESRELMEQANKKQEEELRRKGQALEMERTDRQKLVEEKDQLVQAHGELIIKQKEFLQEVEGLGEKIKKSAREREQLNLRNASDKKHFEDKARQIKDQLVEKQQQFDEVTVKLKTLEKAKQECNQINRERSRRALDDLKSMATNDCGMKTALVDRIPGVVLAWPLEERIGALDDLCLHVILNPNETYKHRWKSQSCRPSINFTQTQINHINAFRLQAVEVIKEMLKGGDDLKHKACDYLDNSLVLHFQPSHSLAPSDMHCQAEWQKLMAESPEIWKFRKHGEWCDSKLANHFRDGRGGEVTKEKKLTQYMTHLSTLGGDEAGKYLLHSHMSNKPEAVDKLRALESLFCHVAFDPKAYTRGAGNVVTDSAEALWGAIVGTSHPREDIVEPSRTKIDHIVLLQQAYRQVLTEFMGRPLTGTEVKALSESRLVKFIPGQYQHEVVKQRVSPLSLEIQSKLEEPQNYDELKRYYKEKYVLEF